MRPAAVPPFRTLDPALAAAERLLATGLSTVVLALPDEALAARRLNTHLASARLLMVPAPPGWRLVCAGAPSELSVAAVGLATLVGVAGWSRLKRCETCGEPFLDRTNGRTRRWCTRHRPHGRDLSTG